MGSCWHLGSAPAAVDAVPWEVLESVFQSDCCTFHLILFVCVSLL